MPNPFNTKIRAAGLLIVGGLISAVSGYLGVTTGGVSLPDVTSGGAESVKVFIANNEFNAFVTATGSTSATERYAAVCIPNPLTRLATSGGTGSLTRLSFEMGNNPAGIGGDVYFTKDCDDKTTTGSTLLINDFKTLSGAVTYPTMSALSSTGALWNGADFIKVTLRGNPTAPFTARVRGAYEDVFGE